MIRNTYTLCLILALTLALVACKPAPNDTSLGTVLSAKTLRVGMMFGPTTYYLGAQGPEGFEYELAKAYAKYLDVELEVVASYSLDDLLPS